MKNRASSQRFVLALAFRCGSALFLGISTAAARGGAAGGGGGNATPGREAITLSDDEVLPPEIKTSLGTMPGVKDLPVRKELPDVLTMNDGTKVTTPEQWAKRRDEMKKILEYYAVGIAPPAPDNLKATVVQTQDVGGGKYTYKLIHLTFGPTGKPDACSLDFGLWTPKDSPPVGVVICQDGSPPGGQQLPRMPQGVNQGRGQDVFSKSLAPLPATDPVPTGGGAGGGAPRGRAAPGAPPAPAGGAFMLSDDGYIFAGAGAAPGGFPAHLGAPGTPLAEAAAVVAAVLKVPSPIRSCPMAMPTSRTIPAIAAKIPPPASPMAASPSATPASSPPIPITTGACSAPGPGVPAASLTTS